MVQKQDLFHPDIVSFDVVLLSLCGVATGLTSILYTMRIDGKGYRSAKLLDPSSLIIQVATRHVWSVWSP